MAKFCTECGAKLPDNASFCPECGAKVFSAPAASPAARVRPGTPQAPAGHTVTRSAPAAVPPPVNRTAPQVQPGQPAAPQAQRTAADARFRSDGDYTAAWRAAPSAAQSLPRSAPAPVQKKSGRRGLSLFLALVMLVELGVAAFRYPGFLREKEPDPYAYSTTKATGKTTTAATTVKPGGKTDEDSDAVVRLGSTRDLTIGFSDKEIAAAPAVSVSVSKENPKAVCGDLQVNFDSWNLPEGEDTFTVRSLGTKTDEAAGWQLECWDLSLASGTHEFITNIDVTVPRTEDDGTLTSFVCYNEETGQWEDLYSEISEDGQYYHVYMPHFSPLAKKFLFGWKENPGKDKTPAGEIFAEHGVDSELFIEVYYGSDERVYKSHRGNTRMTAEVKLDYDLFWKKSEQGKLDGIDQVLTEYSNDAISIRTAFEKLSSVSGLSADEAAAGITGTGLSMVEVMQAGPKAGTPLAGAFSGIGGCLGFMDVAAAYTRITYDAKLRQKTLADSILEDHKLDLISGVSGAVSGIAGTLAAVGVEIPTPVTWGLAAASLVVFAMARANDTIEQFSGSELTEALYNDYVKRPAVFRSARDSYSNYGDSYVYMMPLTTMQDESKYDEFKAWLQKHPLGFGYEGDDSWVPLVKFVVELYKDEPDQVPAILDEIVENRAKAYFQLTDKERENLYWDYKRTLEQGHPLFYTVYSTYSTDDRDKLIAYEVARLKTWMADAADKVMQKMEQDARKDTQDYLEKTLVPLLNQKMEFRVEDSSVKDFKDSVYCHDIYEYPGNEDWKLSAEEAEAHYYATDEEKAELTSATVDYSDPAFMAPMVFTGVTEPAFVPLSVLSKPEKETSVSRNEYYPNADNFLPRAKAYSSVYPDIVFECTMYHYLMMGAPAAMTFRTYPEEALQKPKQGEEPKSYKPESETVVVFKDEFRKNEYGSLEVCIRVTGETGLEAFLGMWVLPGTPHKLEIQLIGDSLFVYEYDGEDSAGGSMDTWKLDPATKTLTLGDDDLIEGGSISVQLKDPDHLIWRGGSGEFTLTKEKDDDE